MHIATHISPTTPNALLTSNTLGRFRTANQNAIATTHPTRSGTRNTISIRRSESAIATASGRMSADPAMPSMYVRTLRIESSMVIPLFPAYLGKQFRVSRLDDQHDM